MENKKKQYSVTIPIAGHVIVAVEAENREEAETIAFDEATLYDIEDWELLKQFNQGNVCYCPSPWEIQVFCEDGDDEDV